jgi:hypothetical protein
MRKVLPNLLNKMSADYISHSRAEAVRKSHEEYAKESVIEEVWRKLEVPLKNLSALSRGNGGPFVMGKTRKRFLLLLAVLKKGIVAREGGKG